MKKILSMSLTVSMLLAVSPIQTHVMAEEKLVCNENFNGYDTVSDLDERWSTQELTSIGEGKGNGKALYVGLDAATDNHMATYRLETPITSGKVIVSYSIKPGENISTNVNMANNSQSYLLNFINTNGEFFEGTATDPAKTFKMGVHELGKWYDFVTTIDLDAQTVTSTMTDENGESVTTAANTISWGTAGGSEMHEITKFRFQVWSKQDSGSYFDNFKVVTVEKDALPFEHNDTVAATNGTGVKFNLGNISNGKYRLSYDFYPTHQGFLALDAVDGQYYFMNYYDSDNGILRYGSSNDPTSNMNAGKDGVVTTAINTENIHHAEIVFDMDSSTSSCVVTDTVTGTEFSKSRDLKWCLSLSPGIDWETVKKDINALSVRTWSGQSTSFSNIKLEQYFEGAVVVQDNITIKDSAGNIQTWDEASSASNTIVIDFGQAMNEETLTSNNVYVQNTSDSKKVNYTGSYADGVYTMNLGELLKDGAEYRIVISKDAATSEGGKNTEDMIFTFNTKESVIVSEDVLNLVEDFDSMTETDPRLVKNVKTALVPDAEGGQMLEQGLTADVDNYITWLKLPVTIESGKYELLYSFKPGSGVTTNILGSNAKGNVNQFFTSISPDGTLRYGSTSDNTAVVKEGAEFDIWYDVKVSFDFDSGESTVLIVDENGNELTKKRDMKWCTTSGSMISDMAKIGIQVWSKTESASYIDNIVFKQIIDAPIITADSITLSSIDGSVSENFAAVSPLTNKVSMDFGTYMDANTLSAENIKLTNKGTGVDLDYTPTYSGGVLTLNIPGILEANTTYSLFVSKDVENALGAALGDDAVIEFTTSDGVTKATLKKITVGNNEITALNQLQKGDKMSICFDYANSTNEAKTLYIIVAYYYDKELVNVDYITDEVAKDITCETHIVNHMVEETEQIDSINIMAWDGFDTMKPISRSLVIR